MSGESKSLADKEYVVYVVLQDQNCASFLSKLKTEHENVFNKTLVQDVRALPVKPPWLKFVPTFVEKKSKKMYAGDEIVEFLKTIPPEFTYSFAGSKSKFSSFDSGTQFNKMDSYNITNAFRLSDASSDGPPSSGGGSAKNAEQQQRQMDSQRRLEEYKEAREAATRTRQPVATPRNLMEDGQPLSYGFSSGPQGYPPQGLPQGYPSGPQGYPPQGLPQGYPPQGLPQGYPSGPQGYPSGPQGYPPGPQGYPPGPQGYPPGPQGYPPGPQGYPPGPQGYPPGPQGYPPPPRMPPQSYQQPPPGYGAPPMYSPQGFRSGY